jgi:hypothetical protein
MNNQIFANKGMFVLGSAIDLTIKVTFCEKDMSVIELLQIFQGADNQKKYELVAFNTYRDLKMYVHYTKESFDEKVNQLWDDNLQARKG